MSLNIEQQNSTSEDEEDVLGIRGPTISSSDPLQRKSARKLRIAKREEALKKHEQANIEGNESNSFEDEECIGSVEKQAAECIAVLEHLLADGEERVTNIRVANDAREIARRFSEAEKKKELLDKLEAEASLAHDKFEKISSRWTVILTLNNPLDIESEVNMQKEKCDDLIAQKDSIITELKEELKRADETFYKDLQKQLNDIKQLGERIDAQVTLMKNAYQSQLELIESSIQIERSNTIEKNEKRWNALYKQRNKDEVDNIEEKLAQVVEFREKMDVLKIEQREKFRMTKIQLEMEVQTLHKELQELKTSCLVNSEKIDYNYQILKRREEENLSVKSQQRRRLNKMQDTINELKSRLKTATNEGMTEKIKSERDIQRLESSMLELQTKADHFAIANEKKYQQVWKMNREKAKGLIKKINQVDKIIHEQVLGVDWIPTKKDILRQSDLPSYKNALLQFKSVSRDDIEVCMDETESEASLEQSQSTESETSNDKLTRHILNLIADSSGFLIEERLWPLLEKYEQPPAILCKIDNIFNALDIKCEEDMKILIKYFIQYSYCEECDDSRNGSPKSDKSKEIFTKADDVIKSDDEDFKPGEDLEVDDEFIKFKKDIDERYAMSKFSEPEDVSIDNETDLQDLKTASEMKSKDKHTHKMPSKCPYGHPLSIDPSCVLSALRSFVAKHKMIKETKSDAEDTKVIPISRHLSNKDVTLYWEKYKNAFPPHKEKLWDNLIMGLNKYLPILQDRFKLNEEVIQLRKQNVELKNLLRGHVPTAEIPKRKYLTPLSKQFKSAH